MKPTPWPYQEELDAKSAEVLRRRAERLRAVGERTEADAQLALAEFSVGDERFAVEMSALHAVLPLKRVTPVPLAPAQVIGVIRLQSEVVPVLSFASLVRCGWRRDPEVLLVVDADGQRVGFDLEQVPRERFVPQRLVAQARVRPEDGHLEVLAGDTKLVLLDLARLLARVEAGDAD